MPRPNLNARRPGAPGAAKSRNPFVNWMDSRKERRTQIEEEASRLITNKIAQNENIMIDKLNSIDFFNSRLPQKVLENKSDPEQSCGDLEYTAHYIVHMLRKDPQVIKMDIRKFDQKLLTLILLFKQAVEQGDVEAAYAAKGAIMRAVADIRSRIPQEQPELSKLFVEANTEYLDQWITLVLHAQVADRTKENVDELRERLEAAQANHETKIENLKKKILGDDKVLEAINTMKEREHTLDRATWTKEEREVHGLLVERQMDKVTLDLHSQLLQQQEDYLKTTKGKIEVLYAQAIRLPITTDPNLLNKFQESVDNLVKYMAETDAEIDSALKTMDDIEGRLQQLNRAPGALRVQEVVAEEAERALEEIKERQKIESGERALKAKELREKLGLLTDEELALERQRAEQKLRERAEELEREREQQREQEQETIEEEEQEVVYN